ncbi:hypothetical protein PPYR_02046 [Photinus pyralis]|uniref:DUF1758 domain-containing protein n=1 Tax=Photinus pyralis TaxID=7054 RepID=A0A5N4B688_PHOPY|nr:hypothetical protein PPYR_02046 [Photinus pyralis]
MTLKQQRGILKAQLTRLNDYFNKLDQNNISSSTISELQLRLEKFEPHWSTFNTIQSSIEAECVNEEQQLVELDERESFEDDYFSIISKIKNLVLGRDSDKWDDIMIYLFNYFKIRFGHITGMGIRITAGKLLEKVQFNKDINDLKPNYSNFYKGKNTSTVHLSNVKKSCQCFYCKKDHVIYKCPEFLNMSPNARISAIKKRGLCMNCLNLQIVVLDLSLDLEDNRDITHPSKSSNNETAITMHSIKTNYLVLLSTALVFVPDKHGYLHKFRALLDNGSQSNFVTKKVCDQLGLEKQKVNFAISGVGQSLQSISNQVTISITSINKQYHTQVKCLVINKITEKLPKQSFNKRHLNIPSDVTLADEKFNETGPIDILLGAAIFWEIINKNTIKLGRDNPVLQDTKLGWILEANILQLGENECNKTLGMLWNACNDSIQFSINDNLNNQISKRTILSTTCQIFDPLGLLGPIIIISKIIIQKLWQLKLEWDQPIPNSISTDWVKFRSELSVLNTLNIARHVVTPDALSIEMHGFADASEKAYDKQIPQSPLKYSDHVLPEQRTTCLVDAIPYDDVTARYSSIDRLQRVVAYCFRFFRNCKYPKQKELGPLSVDELQLSLNRLLPCEQDVNEAIKDKLTNYNFSIYFNLTTVHNYTKHLVIYIFTKN